MIELQRLKEQAAAAQRAALVPQSVRDCIGSAVALLEAQQSTINKLAHAVAQLTINAQRAKD